MLGVMQLSRQPSLENVTPDVRCSCTAGETAGMPPSAVEGSGLCPGEQGSDFRRHNQRDLNAEDKGLYQHLFFNTKHKEKRKKRNPIPSVPVLLSCWCRCDQTDGGGADSWLVVHDQTAASSQWLFGCHHTVASLMCPLHLM